MRPASGIQTDSGDIDKVEGKFPLCGQIYNILVFAVPLFYIAMGHMIGLPLPRFIDPDINPLNFALVQLFLTIPTVIAGYKFYTVGFKTMFKGSPNMDSLVAMGTSAAFIYGLYAIWQIYLGNTDYAMHLYFETAGVIITLILLGKTLETVAKDVHPMPLKLWILHQRWRW